VHEFNGRDGTTGLPSLPAEISAEREEGEEAELVGSTWIVRTVGNCELD
jgi:hypothetical protein